MPPPVVDVTVSVTEAVLPESDSVAVIVAVPTATPVMIPVELTVATDVFDDDHVIVDEVRTVAPLELVGVAVKVEVDPTATVGAAGVIVRVAMVEAIVIDRAAVLPAVMVTVWLALAWAVPVPSELGYATAFSVSEPAGKDAKLTVDVLPELGLAIV